MEQVYCEPLSTLLFPSHRRNRFVEAEAIQVRQERARFGCTPPAPRMVGLILQGATNPTRENHQPPWSQGSTLDL